MNWSILIAALISVESGGNDMAVGDNGMARGALQIHLGVVTDVNKLLSGGIPEQHFSHEDMHDGEKAALVCKIYLEHYGRKYASKTRKVAGYEELARIWNGGYHGTLYNSGATDGYWEKVKNELRALGVSEDEL